MPTVNLSPVIGKTKSWALTLTPELAANKDDVWTKNVRLSSMGSSRSDLRVVGYGGELSGNGSQRPNENETG